MADAGNFQHDLRMAYFLVLEFQQPGIDLRLPFAVVVLDQAQDKLHIRGREQYDGVACIDDEEVLIETVKQLQADAVVQSGQDILDNLESTLSNSIRITDRIAFRCSDIAMSLGRLSSVFLS